jgi:hypothetical protein
MERSHHLQADEELASSPGSPGDDAANEELAPPSSKLIRIDPGDAVSGGYMYICVIP